VLKRYIIFLFLSAAYTVLQAHNFIPHHHESEFIETGNHHDHEDHDDHDNNPPFTDLTHNADFGKVIAKPEVIKGVNEETILFTSCFIEIFYKPGLLKQPSEYHPPGDDSSLHLIFLSHSLPLRAPPVC
jgi:hypothetical protein